MQANLLWKGTEYNSLENCLADFTPQGLSVKSMIYGYYKGTIYMVEYAIKTDQNWHTLFLEIKSVFDNQVHHFCLVGDGQGNWTMNGKPAEQYSGCLDVDISLSPFTNTLPIRRLKLEKGQSHEIKVIYCDILAHHITPVRQGYTCLSKTSYHYENIPNDFEATITVDENSLVIDYPTLFIRQAALKSNYDLAEI